MPIETEDVVAELIGELRCPLEGLIDHSQYPFEPWARAKMKEAADLIQSLSERIDVLEGALLEEREENLWNAYNCGVVKDGRWTHMFMSEGEWLARQCGFDSKLYDYDDAAIRAAIPNAARASLTEGIAPNVRSV